MDIYYNIVSLKHYTKPDTLDSGEIIDFPLTDTLADIEVEDFEEAIKVLREQCKNPDATEVALYYVENCYGERWYFEDDEKNPHEYSHYRYGKSEINLFVADRQKVMQDRAENPKEWNEISDSNNFHCQFYVSHDEFDEEEVTGGYAIANVFIDDYDEAMFYLKQQSKNPEVNNIDLYVANGCSDRMISFCTSDHPYAEGGYTFEDIDEFARTERDAHNKRMTDPDPLEMEMQYIDLWAGITPEQFAAGKTVDEVKASIPDCDEQIHRLLNMLSYRMLDAKLADEFDECFDAGLPFFWDGLVDSAPHEEDWQKAWGENGLNEFFMDFQQKYFEKSSLSQEALDLLCFHNQIAYLYYFYGIYFHGLKYYVV